MFEDITTQEQLDLICKDLSKYTDKELLELYKASIRIEKLSLNEMAYSRGQFIGLCGNLCDQIHYNIINIVILGNEICPENVYHWQSELMAHVNKLFNQSVEKSVKKEKIVYEYIIDVYNDSITFKYDDTSIICAAIKDEIKKGSKSNVNKITVQYIQTHILPHINELLLKYNDIFAKIFKSLYETFKENNITIFKNYLNQYLND